ATFEATRVHQFVASFADAVRLLPAGVNLSRSDLVLPQRTEEARFEAEMHRIQADLAQWLAAKGMQDYLAMEFSQDGLTLRFADSLLFQTGSAALSVKILPLLDRIGESIHQTRYAVRIEGHTDNVPIRTRRYPSNWELSTARAVNVLRYLIKHRDVPAHRLTAVGCSAYRPLTTNDNWRNRSQNRRVEIIFHRGE
ncbi:MAG: flagellar motor protein MotB, partial [Desulfobacterales bacterium]